MKPSKIFFILCLASVSTAPLYAAIPSPDSLKPAILSVCYDRNAVASTQDDLQATYKQKCLDTLKSYFSITPDMLPKNASFTVYLISEKTLAADKEKSLQSYAKDLQQKKISQNQYDKNKKAVITDYNNRLNILKNVGHDYVSCELRLAYTTNSRYYLGFNAVTGELDTAITPFSKEGYKPLKDYVDHDTPYTISDETTQLFKSTGPSFITTHHLGGITTPKLVRNTSINYIYYDAADPTKKVMLTFDPATHKVVNIDTGANVTIFEQIKFK